MSQNQQPPAQASSGPPTPHLFFDTANAYVRTAAIKAAVELDLFTAIAEGKQTPADLALRCKAAERGVRILCDYLTVVGMLVKGDGRYTLTPDSATFLDRRSPAYLGGTLEFFLSPALRESFEDLTGAVRKGGTVASSLGTLAPEHEVWVKFARAMMPMMAPAAQQLAALVLAGSKAPMKVLDVAAGHGIFGIAFAQANPAARVVGLDWPNVLEVAKANAAAMGVGERYGTIAGSAFEADLGGGYDVVLLPNFLHHFDAPTCQTLLRRVRPALKEDGRVATLEFIPNDDRVSPPMSATFAMTMLGTTPAGDAYTFAEYERMFRDAGFPRNELHELPGTIQRVIVSRR